MYDMLVAVRGSAAALREKPLAIFDACPSPPLKWFRKEHIFPKIMDRDTYDTWVSLGSKSTAERAREEVERILSHSFQSTLDEHIQKELQKIMEAEAKQNGIKSLPAIRS